jgi:hypothetical protein
LAALLAAFTGVLLLLTGLLLPAALLLLSRRSLATLLLTLLLIAALIVLSIFVWISHFNYLIVSTNSLITSLTIGKHDHNDP